MAETGFDAAEFSVELGEAGQALIALAEGPGQVAAGVISDGFARASREIEAALLRAARTGEVSFSGLFRDILDQLARLAAEVVIDAAGLGGGTRGGAAASALNVVFNLGQGADAGSVMANQGRIAQGLASALRAGGRFT